MDSKFPKNFKEGILFGISNCIVMVSGMMTFNLFINGVLTIENLVYGFLPVFLFAFIFSETIVGPIVEKITEKFSVRKYMPFFRVLFMAATMTFVAPLMQSGHIVSLSHYIIAFCINYVVALFLQVFIAMRFATFLLGKYRLLK